MNVGQRIKSARVMAGLSMRQLAEQLDLSATAISKFENEKLVPRQSTLLKIARVLDVPLRFFTSQEVVEITEPAFRKKSGTSKKSQQQIEELVKYNLEKHLQARRLFAGQRDLSAKVKRHSFKVSSLDETEEAAQSLREGWGLGTGPIDDMVARFEDNGIVVLLLDIDPKFDGFSCWGNSHVPVMVSSSNVSGDRQRFNLAHELGHLVLDISNDQDPEKVAHRFAGAFLIPRDTLFMELGHSRTNLNVRELMILKREYKMSMQAIIRRAYDLGVISKHTYERIFRLFSSQGWRTNEPGDRIHVEQPLKFELLVDQALAEKIITPTMASELLGTPRKSLVPVGDLALVKASQQLYDSYLEDMDLVAIDAEMLEDQ